VWASLPVRTALGQKGQRNQGEADAARLNRYVNAERGKIVAGEEEKKIKISSENHGAPPNRIGFGPRAGNEKEPARQKDSGGGGHFTQALVDVRELQRNKAHDGGKSIPGSMGRGG